MLAEHTHAANPDIEFHIDPLWLDPVAGPEPYGWDVIHLNYHRGLHSRWTPEVLRAKVPPGTAVVITFHDTYEVQPDDLPQNLLALDCVKAMVVHEPCDLEEFPKVHYWRQACPERSCCAPLPFNNQLEGWRPTLGTLGFDFPWKNYDRLARVTGELGWNLRIVGQVTEERQAVLRELNPRIHFDGYVPTHMAVANLESCDATAFLYDCANSGTSAAIRLGIAAGRPLIATAGCRQFRDLRALDQAPAAEEPRLTGITWIEPTAKALDYVLSGWTMSMLPKYRGYDPALIALAHRERWPLLGAKYAALYAEAIRG